MHTLRGSLFVFTALLTLYGSVNAQDGKKLREPAPAISNIYIDDCHLCDSLGDAYMKAGDTSMGLWYYQQYLDAHSEEADKKNLLIRQTRLYYGRQSFYLTGY